MGGGRLKEKGVDGRRSFQVERTAHAKAKVGELCVLVKELRKGQDGWQGGEQGWRGQVIVCLLSHGKDFGFYLKQRCRI